MTSPFILRDRPAHWWPVSIGVPVDGGQVETHTFRCKFIRLDVDEMREVWGNLLPEDAPREDRAKRNIQIFMRSVEDWDMKGEVDGRPQPLPFNEANIARALRYPGMMTAVETAYLNFWAGVPEIVRGNSGPSPAGGPATAEAAAATAAATSDISSSANSEPPKPTTST